MTNFFIFIYFFKAHVGSNQTPFECTPKFLNALQLFWSDIEQAIDLKIKDLGEQKGKLKSILDDSCHDIKIAITTMKNLKKELETARLTLSNSDTKIITMKLDTSNLP